MSFEKKIYYYQGNRPEMIKYVPSSAKRILEVGCGEGLFAKLLLAGGEKEVWGVELNSEAAQIASQSLTKVYVGAIENVMNELPGAYFDLIIFNDVLEHLVDPSLVLTGIRQKLNNEGQILASIPNLRFAKVIYNLLIKKDFTYTEMGILDSTHLRFFTINTIKKLFIESGYDIEFLEGIDRSGSLFTRAFVFLLSIITLRNNKDALFKQFVIIAKK